MSFDSGTLTTSAITRVRLTVGDISEDWPILEDSVYEYLLLSNNSDEHVAAIEALENIINFYALNPTNETFGDISGSQFNIKVMERRLTNLKLSNGKVGVQPVPILLKTDRKNWNDFDKIFGGS